MGVIWVALFLVLSGCKTSNSKQELSSVRSGGASQIQLTDEQTKIVGQYLTQMTAHVLRFDNDSSLRDRLAAAFKTCKGDKREQSSTTLSSSQSFREITACPTADKKTLGENLKFLHALRRSPAFETAIDRMLNEVLPTLFDQIYDKISAEGPHDIDAATSDRYINTLNSIAISAEKIAQGFSWRPGYLITSRYLHQIVLTELGKADISEIDWALLKEAVDLHMSVSPYAEGDLGVSPLVVKPSSPLYATLYGPTPRGPAYWLMKAAVSLRLEKVGSRGNPSGFNDFNEWQDLKTVLEQIALESTDDQAVIKRGVAHLTEKAYDFTR